VSQHHQHKLLLPQLFKGIALFTPGGDLVYCVDPYKQSRWHLQLCAVLQEMLELSEPPHFLVPYYSATIDRWIDPQTQQVHVAAEACPLVLKHQALLNVVFEAGDLVWRPTLRQTETHDPLVLMTYRQQFAQLWQDHDLVVRFEQARIATQSLHDPGSDSSWLPQPQQQTKNQGYVLRLFVAGHTSATEHILYNLHQLLEKSLHQPYTLKVVDIYKHPEQAESDQVTATPTLVKVYPEPVRRIVGDLSDVNRVLKMLVSLRGDRY
jgi:circadian clock protein KaiB